MKEGKSVVAATILSVLWPGIGQIYLGQIGKGIAFFVAAIFGWWLTLTLIGAILGIPILIVVYLWAPINAYMAAKAPASA